jgi:hypothetical protein
VNDARVLDKEKRNPRWGENEHFKMYMLIPEEWNGWAGFCYTLFFIFCCFEMGPAKVGISRRLSSSSPGTVIKTAWFCVTFFFVAVGRTLFELLRPISFTYPSIITIILKFRNLNDAKQPFYFYTCCFTFQSHFCTISRSVAVARAR